MSQPSQGRLVEQSVKDLAEIRANLQEESDAFRHVAVSTGNALREVLALAHRENVRFPRRFVDSSDSLRSLRQNGHTHNSLHMIHTRIEVDVTSPKSHLQIRMLPLPMHDSVNWLGMSFRGSRRNCRSKPACQPPKF